MFEIVFLGTSASAPSIHRGLSAQVGMVQDQRFLIDCGEGTQRQILRSRIGFKRLNRVLLTHGHLDHILGLAGLLSTLMRWESLHSLEIWGGSWTLDRVQDLIHTVVLRGVAPPMPLHLFDLKPGVLLEDRDYSVSAFPVQHRGRDNFGFAFTEKSRRPFLVERAEALGVPVGPERARLVRGESIRLNNGRVIHPDEVLGPDVPGAKLVYIGDIGTLDGPVREVVRGAHTLVIEGTYLDADAEMADAFGHMTIGRAARFANELDVGTLIITHVSRRYRERDMIREAQQYHPHAFVARDFDRFLIAKGRPAEKLEGTTYAIDEPEDDDSLLYGPETVPAEEL
jgi:ribonuclease Z